MKTKFKQGDLKATVSQEVRDGAVSLVLTVSTTLPVDRADHVYAWSFGMNQKGLCDRLARCVNDGKAFDEYEILTDVYGKTYVSASTVEFFHKRHMNGSLKKLGY